MGSKVTPRRKGKDTFTMREPITTSTVGGGKLSRQDMIAEFCDISFHVKVKETPFVKKGVPVTLQKQNDIYFIFVLGNAIKALDAKLSGMIEVCAGFHVSYAGKIINENNTLYARFTRIVR